ncbi:MAG: histidine triad nucleotide-binding protein [Patescibacteria group bacterium]|jgi:histidine triad (HIT) family protein
MPEDCIFCKIAKKEIPTEIVFEDEDFIAFKDVKPKAPIHVILIPKMHIGPHFSVSEEHGELLGKMMIAAAEIARIVGVDRSGYRLVMNSGPDSGMEIDHLHMHILGGGQLGPIA